jgi:hypothetical protein
MGIACLVAGIGILGCAALAFKIYGPIGWRSKVRGLATMLAIKDAKSDYSKGVLKVYVLSIGQDDRSRYTGTNIGPFQAWTLGCHEEYGEPNRVHLETYAEVYNRTAKKFSEDNQIERDASR